MGYIYGVSRDAGYTRGLPLPATCHVTPVYKVHDRACDGLSILILFLRVFLAHLFRDSSQGVVLAPLRITSRYEARRSIILLTQSWRK